MSSTPIAETSAPSDVTPLDRKKKNSWAMNPTSGELSLLYLTLGLHIATGTDAVVPPFWWVVLWMSVWIAGAWLVARMLAFGFAWIGGTRDARWGRWTQVLCAVIVFFLIHSTAWGFMVRVWLTESWIREDVESLQRLVKKKSIEEINDLRNFAEMGLRMGPFTEPELRNVLDDGKTILWRTVQGDSFFQPPFVLDGGLMYCESGIPPKDWSEFYVDHLYGPWWRWRMGD